MATKEYTDKEFVKELMNVVSFGALFLALLALTNPHFELEKNVLHENVIEHHPGDFWSAGFEHDYPVIGLASFTDNNPIEKIECLPGSTYYYANWGGEECRERGNQTGYYSSAWDNCLENKFLVIDGVCKVTYHKDVLRLKWF